MKLYKTAILKWILPFLAVVLSTAAVPAPVNKQEDSLELKYLLDKHHQVNMFEVCNVRS